MVRKTAGFHFSVATIFFFPWVRRWGEICNANVERLQVISMISVIAQRWIELILSIEVNMTSQRSSNQSSSLLSTARDMSRRPRSSNFASPVLNWRSLISFFACNSSSAFSPKMSCGIETIGVRRMDEVPLRQRWLCSRVWLVASLWILALRSGESLDTGRSERAKCSHNLNLIEEMRPIPSIVSDWFSDFTSWQS